MDPAQFKPETVTKEEVAARGASQETLLGHGSDSGHATRRRTGVFVVALMNEVALRKRAAAESDRHRHVSRSPQGRPPEEIRRAVSVADAGRPHRRAGRQDVGQRGRGRWTPSSATISCASRACCRSSRTGRSSRIHKLQPVADSEVDVGRLLSGLQTRPGRNVPGAARPGSRR